MGKLENPELYMPRILDKKLEACLKTFGAVCITGPKWCGKSWTALYHCNSEFLLQNPTNNFHNRNLADMSPESVLEGETPRLIDEWEDVPKLWDAIRYTVDKRGKKGQFILTGSSSPKNLKVLHDGTGRIEKLQMNTMSLYETGDSDGSVSLEKLCNGEFSTHLTEGKSLKELARYIIRGGWPENLGDVPDISMIPKSYVNHILDWNTEDIDGIKYNKYKITQLLRSLARNESTTALTKALQRDIINDNDYNEQDPSKDGISHKSINRYMDYLSRMYVVDNIPPFGLNLRDPSRVKQAVKRHFCDPSLAAAILDATPQKLMNDLVTFGFLFESLCEHDLKIYAESFGASLYHYQDYLNHEIDAVIDLPDGNWCAFEIKLGANQIQSAAKNLLSASSYIEESKGKKPSILCVICGMDDSARRLNNGVYVVPVTTLKP